LCIGVFRNVAGEESDVVSIDPTKITEFLVGERFDGGRVHNFAASAERFVHAEFGNDGLPGPSWRRDHHRIPMKERLDRLALECIKPERIEDRKLINCCVNLLVRQCQMQYLLGGPRKACAYR
jgi:hypothetical protein